MIKSLPMILFLLAISVGLAAAFQSVDQTTQSMQFTGGPGFPPVDVTTQPMMFTGQE
ncbi:MAG: hypothetical protein MRJ96_08315 [Nitrospirales bacterium]|nr:hypothetical protein [Nitrospira sp.]MDR4501436.1 hypothetical protein [Nitrospirales bacterium]